MPSAWLSLGAPDPIPASPMLIRPASSLMSKFARGSRVGGSFTGLSVRRKLALLVAEPSLTVSVIVELPKALDTGEMAAVRLEPPPPNTILVNGTRAGLDDAALRVRLPAAVSASPTTN